MFRKLIPVFLGLLASVSGAQSVGSKMPMDFELDDFTQTGAEALADFQGRALLIEFFAYW